MAETVAPEGWRLERRKAGDWSDGRAGGRCSSVGTGALRRQHTGRHSPHVRLSQEIWEFNKTGARASATGSTAISQCSWSQNFEIQDYFQFSNTAQKIGNYSGKPTVNVFKDSRRCLGNECPNQTKMLNRQQAHMLLQNVLHIFKIKCPAIERSPLISVRWHQSGHHKNLAAYITCLQATSESLY